MTDNKEKLKELNARQAKWQTLSSFSVIALGLSAQAVVRPPSVLPFLRDETVAYSVLVLGVLGVVIATMKILPVFREKALLEQQREGS